MRNPHVIGLAALGAVLLVVAAIGSSLAAKPHTNTRLFTFTTSHPDEQSATHAGTSAVAQVLTKRARIAGIYASKAHASGSTVSIRVKPSETPENEFALLTGQGGFAARPILASETSIPPGSTDVLAEYDYQHNVVGYYKLGPPVLTDSDIASTQAEQTGPPEGPYWDVVVNLTPRGTSAYEDLTAEQACHSPSDITNETAYVVGGAILQTVSPDQSVPCTVGITGGVFEVTSLDATRWGAMTTAALVGGGSWPADITLKAASNV